MSEKTDNIADTGGFEFILTKSPMTGTVEEKKAEPKVETKAKPVATAPPRPVQPVAQPCLRHR